LAELNQDVLMFEKLIALFRRRKAEPAKRVPGDMPKRVPGDLPKTPSVPRAGGPRAPADAPPDFGATLMIRRPPLEKAPEAPAQDAAASGEKKAG
jgi:hypothetical protein